ncbi:MAG: hypothetical protein FJ303_05220 [Planctomycetes bacterium]|nr:hypothetical protein [Planctomycetota bacterium]
MRHAARALGVFAFALLLALSPAHGDAKKKSERRFGFDVDQETYPQGSPEATIKSIVKALNGGRVDYLLAHMADPAFVDYWVDRYQRDFTQGKEEGKRLLAFDRLVRETMMYFENDPLLVKDLRTFAKEAKWSEEGDVAVGVVEANPDRKIDPIARKVFLKKIGERWFLENKQQ